jgi:hypothetical protein
MSESRPGDDGDATDATAADGSTTPSDTGPSTDPAVADGADRDLRERMAAAVAAVRREGRKVALLYAALDAALAAALANLAIRVGTGDVLPSTLALPAAVRSASGLAAVRTATVLTGAAFAVVLAGEYLVRVRRPLVERFEAANPAVSEALRTARDALDDAADTRMARRLYADVLDRLRGTSTAGLIDWRRVVATLAVVMAVSVVGVQVAVSDVSLPPLDGGPGDTGGGGPAGGVAGAGGGATDAGGGLRNGSEILGEPEDVSAGDDPLNATVDTQPGPGEERPSPPDAYDQSGYEGSTEIEGQRAGFADEEPPADADLIRDYTLAIRDENDE